MIPQLVEAYMWPSGVVQMPVTSLEGITGVAVVKWQTCLPFSLMCHKPLLVPNQVSFAVSTFASYRLVSADNRGEIRAACVSHHKRKNKYFITATGLKSVLRALISFMSVLFFVCLCILQCGGCFSNAIPVGEMKKER